MEKGIKISVTIVIAVIYFLLVLVDIGLNFLGLIPFVGSAFESISEVVIETLSAIIFIVVTLFVMRDD